MSAPVYGCMIKTIAFAGSARGGAMGARDEISAERANPMAAEQVVPGPRPIIAVDGLAEIQFSDHADAGDIDDDPGNLVVTYATSDGGSAEVESGPYVIEMSARVVGSRGGSPGDVVTFTTERLRLSTDTGDLSGITRTVSI